MKVTFLRLKGGTKGGAETYLDRLKRGVERGGVETAEVNCTLPRSLPGWLRLTLFVFKSCRRKRENDCYFSLERVPCADIYRAGDGVHRVFLKRVPKPFWYLNPLHWAILYLERQTFLRAKRVIANSKMVKKEILEHFPVPAEKVEVVYNGVPLPEEWRGEEEQLRRELGIPSKIPVILLVGSGFKRKGVEPALQLLSMLPGEWRFVVVGKEKRLSYYRKLAERLGVAERTIFTGPRSDVERFYRLASILLLPTFYDPFANVTLEGAGYGVVPITTRFNGAAEVLPERWVMESPTDTSILPYLSRLIADPLLLRQEGELARQIAERYPIENNVEATLRVVKGVCGNRTGDGEKRGKNGRE